MIRFHTLSGRAALVCLICLVSHGCAQDKLLDAGTRSNAVEKPHQSSLKVALLGPRNHDEQIRKTTKQLARRTELTLARPEAGYYVDVQEAQLRQTLQGSNVGLFRESDSIVLRISGSAAFDTNSRRLNPEVLPALATISGILSEYRKTFVVVNSHTDKSGEAGYNQKLSEQRAIAVAHFLVRKGVDADRIAAIGHGERRPLDQTSTRDRGWPQRRIEIRLEPIVEPSS